ncbi:MAG TPA: SigE family RNA polymerase sigma factor [Mycobacteriales bacterium]|nr:SigE family RNA polymerase sigma factor [Mycobacteriales bacterium]
MESTGGRPGGSLPPDRDAAVSALFLAHHARLVGLARLLVDDLPTAEDVVQDAFAELYRRWRWLRDPDAAVGYLRTAVTNGARSRLRRRQVARGKERPAPGSAPSAEHLAMDREDHREVVAGVSALPRRQREVVVLRYYLDLSEAEIANTLNISKGTVKAHTSRALAALTATLEHAR